MLVALDKAGCDDRGRGRRCGGQHDGVGESVASDVDERGGHREKPANEEGGQERAMQEWDREDCVNGATG